VLGWLMVIAVVVTAIYLLNCIVVLSRLEHGVVFRLGRLLPNVRKPGVTLVFKPMERLVRVNTAEQAFAMPRREMRTVRGPRRVEPVVRFRVADPMKAVAQAFNYVHSVAITSKDLLDAELDRYADRPVDTRSVASAVQHELAQKAREWGVQVDEFRLDVHDEPAR
jgi:regulator of protease activity HflC (stomatin/prohibitin superfamily)